MLPVFLCPFFLSMVEALFLSLVWIDVMVFWGKAEGERGRQKASPFFPN